MQQTFLFTFLEKPHILYMILYLREENDDVFTAH